MTVTDKDFCASSFLMYRTIVDKKKSFSSRFTPNFADYEFPRSPVCNSDELYDALKRQVEAATQDGKAALALSGGIDSAILAQMMPEGAMTYTFKCIVPGIEVTDESKIAAEYALKAGLRHKVIEIYWEDYEKYAPLLMKHKGMPIHSIEVQIYKAALQAKADGFEKFIFGENADIIYGGMTGLLAKDWNFGEFVDRYSYVMPYRVYRNAQLILEPFMKYEHDGKCDAYNFINEYFRWEALGTYNNACETANMKFIGPFSNTFLAEPIDLDRIRAGEGKYLVREIFKKLYKDFKIPPKVPMPRATNEWLKDWGGPTREEFYPHCIEGMSGDQKWMVMALEMFLNIMDER